MNPISISRREFMKRAGVISSASALLARAGSASVRQVPSLPIGYSTISWPAEDFEHALDTIAKLGFQGVQLVGWARDRYANRVDALRERLAGLHLVPVAQSCWGVKLDPASPTENSETFRAYAQFFKQLGGTILQVTDGGKPDRRYSAEQIRRLGADINDLGRIARDFGLTLGYHPHVGSYGESESGVRRILGATDANLVKLIADTGHLALGGMDPAVILLEFRERLLMAHLKDVRHDALAAARNDRRSLRDRKYLFCEIGSGALDLAGIVRTLGEIQFKGWSVVELDGNHPPPGGPDEGVRINREGLKRLGLEPQK